MGGYHCRLCETFVPADEARFCDDCDHMFHPGCYHEHVCNRSTLPPAAPPFSEETLRRIRTGAGRFAGRAGPAGGAPARRARGVRRGVRRLRDAGAPARLPPPSPAA